MSSSRLAGSALDRSGMEVMGEVVIVAVAVVVVVVVVVVVGECLPPVGGGEIF